jgi:hypothetical protein
VKDCWDRHLNVIFQILSSVVLNEFLYDYEVRPQSKFLIVVSQSCLVFISKSGRLLRAKGATLASKLVPSMTKGHRDWNPGPGVVVQRMAEIFFFGTPPY